MYIVSALIYDFGAYDILQDYKKQSQRYKIESHRRTGGPGVCR